MSKTLLQIRLAQRANAARYHASHKDDPAYQAKRKARWQTFYERRKVKRQLEKEKAEGV